LHHCVSGQPKHVVFVEFYLEVRDLSSLHADQRFSSAFFDFLHGKSDLLLAVFYGRDEDLPHDVLELDLNHALELAHIVDKVFVHLPIFVLLLVVSHLFALLLVVKVDLLLLFINNVFGL
jgi:hypothetical protein